MSTDALAEKRIEVKKKITEDYIAASKKIANLIAQTESKLMHEEAQKNKLNAELSNLCRDIQEVFKFSRLSSLF